jgi:hypothetical protein
MKMQGMSSLYFAECFHSSVVGGTEAAVGEFPSMVFPLEKMTAPLQVIGACFGLKFLVRIGKFL